MMIFYFKIHVFLNKILIYTYVSDIKLIYFHVRISFFKNETGLEMLNFDSTCVWGTRNSSHLVRGDWH